MVVRIWVEFFFQWGVCGGGKLMQIQKQRITIVVQNEKGSVSGAFKVGWLVRNLVIVFL